MRGMLFGAACLTCAVFMAVWHLASPREVTRTVTKTRTAAAVLPAQPTLAQIKAAFGKLATVADEYAMVGDTPMHCWAADSSFDPQIFEGITWQAQWCWEVSADEFERGMLGGPTG